MADFIYSEYRDVVRVDADTMVPQAGYRYFAADDYPLPSLQYAREMTLARGRILYEVWDHWRNMFVGYIVPSPVFHEALAHRDGPSPSVWSNLRPDRRLICHQTYRIITERFPRVHLMSARLITESCFSEYDRMSVPSHQFIEAAVVEHVRNFWT
ncbi:hypothetical protein M409DRAFT_21400 [Zasmidium cellare ATCC 36951]|uniref:Uncharacterized protein n=1 Tax=Zasmidium cellare ATCC 36951 TaxID=1080233 RepID=A0A6A6CR59_ZASCE|nr:uncharacterized protein M409DRAFT_21400 [Zasmidium cellare ATCC 36951]KAF2168658.1 hypothetical protein M409DRAFT_21400 [Zasmidium cellare ATCC 36951]